MRRSKILTDAVNQFGCQVAGHAGALGLRMIWGMGSRMGRRSRWRLVVEMLLPCGAVEVTGNCDAGADAFAAMDFKWSNGASTEACEAMMRHTCSRACRHFDR